MSDIVRFEATDFEVIEINGERAVRVSDLARALGYVDHRPLHHLLERRSQEFLNKIRVLNLDTEGNQPVKFLIYPGVIRAAMLSNAPRAKEFRDWAEDVLFKVMTQGHYLSPALTHRIDNLESAVTTLVHAFQGRLMLAPPDVTHWLTPTERLRQLLYHRNKTLPYGFNQRGHFDGWCAVRYRDEFGSIQLKPRRLPKLTLAPVVEPRPEVDLFLLEMYKRYVADNPAKQERLKLVPGKEEIPHV